MGPAVVVLVIADVVVWGGVTKAEAPEQANRHKAKTEATNDLMVLLLFLLILLLILNSLVCNDRVCAVFRSSSMNHSFSHRGLSSRKHIIAMVAAEFLEKDSIDR